MSHLGDRPHRAGGPITDLCRACKAVRDHTVMAVDAGGRALRVVCDFCGSQHNYRGGGGEDAGATPLPRARPIGAGVAQTRLAPAPRLPSPAPAQPDSPRPTPPERTPPPMTDATPESASDLASLLRRVLREELGLTPVAPAAKWRGGQLLLRPGRPGLQEKVLPIDALFHKVVMIRNKLRTLEQQ